MYGSIWICELGLLTIAGISVDHFRPTGKLFQQFNSCSIKIFIYRYLTGWFPSFSCSLVFQYKTYNFVDAVICGRDLVTYYDIVYYS